uniref:Uncharacterized protein n=1 Tax=Anguilla anguilla TaxID=7936 RepID=A0A0E9S2E3_ANGAN
MGVFSRLGVRISSSIYRPLLVNQARVDCMLKLHIL